MQYTPRGYQCQAQNAASEKIFQLACYNAGMDAEDIDRMEAGRELDAEAHRALYPRHNIETFQNIGLLLWHYCDGEHEKPQACRWKEVPQYSTDIAAAWLVVEKLLEDWHFQ